MKIVRRRQRQEAEYPTGRFWMHWPDLTVNPWLCPDPHVRYLRKHWTEDRWGPTVFDEMTGQEVVLGVCEHMEPTRRPRNA